MRETYRQEVNSFFDSLPESSFEPIGCLFCPPKTPSAQLFTKGSMRVHRCECGFVWNARQPTAATLDSFYASSPAMSSWAYIKTSTDEMKRQTEKFEGAIREIATMGAKSVLDVGCGTGVFLGLLKYNVPAIRCLGVEPHKESAEAAQASGVNVFAGTFSQFCDVCPSLTYDVITLWGVLEHVKDPFSVLYGIKNKLNPGGRIIVCVPNADSTIVQATWKNCFTFCPQHLWYFNINQLSELFGRCGLNMLSSYTIEPESRPVLRVALGFDPYRRSFMEDRFIDPKVAELEEAILKTMSGYKIVASAVMPGEPVRAGGALH